MDVQGRLAEWKQNVLEDLTKAEEVVKLDAVSQTVKTTDEVLDCMPLSSPL